MAFYLRVLLRILAALSGVMSNDDDMMTMVNEDINNRH